MTKAAAVIDLDGVVYRGGRNGQYQLIPGAVESLKRLDQADVPYVFVTNGTCCTEAEKARTITNLCRMPITERQIVLASTPMQHLVSDYQDRHVLIVAWSSDLAYKLAKAQGWSKVISIQDFASAHPILTPSIHREERCSTPEISMEDIAAVLVFSQPSNWYEGIQILCDLVQRREAVPIFAGNPDIEYPTTHSVPRFTMGAFLHAFQALYSYSTGQAAEIQFQGKPYAPIYHQAEEMLKELHPNASFRVIYAIGDNPKSDIRGANEAGTQYHSILVKTGVFDATLTNDEEFPAQFVCPSIVQAVEYILARNLEQ